MKLKYILIIALVIIMAIGGFYYMKYRKEKVKDEDLEIANIKSFYITYTNGYMMSSYTRYQLTIKDGIYMVEIKPYGVGEEDKLETEVTIDLLEEITKILKKYEVNKWDGFDKTDQGVLDGDSFSFLVSFNNDKSIHASGYMMWPKNYRNVRDEISTLFMNIYNKEKGIKEDE